jgi:hypothetical protein
MQSRRKLIAKIGSVGTITIAGCSGVSEPELTVRDLGQTEPRVLSVSAEPSGDLGEYTAEIRNTGSSGPVLVELFWGETTFSSPVREEITYYNSNETREFSFLQEPPELADSFQILATGLGYTADIINSGGDGTVNVRLIDSVSETTIAEKTLNLAEDENRAVEFETEHEFIDDFVIEAVPVQ